MWTCCIAGWSPGAVTAPDGSVFYFSLTAQCRTASPAWIIAIVIALLNLKLLVDFVS